MKRKMFFRGSGQQLQHLAHLHLGWLIVFAIVLLTISTANAIPQLDKSRYHTWEEVDAYLDAIGQDPQLRHIVKLMPIGFSREGRPLRVLRISRKGIFSKHPETKPATFIMGAHHAREHVSKEVVLALIDKIIHSYGHNDAQGQAITYLVDAGTFYLLPWVNPDGGMNQFFHNLEQRKTNYAVDEPQIDAAECDTCGDGLVDQDSPDFQTGDVGEISLDGRTIVFGNNGIIGRHLQLWYEKGDYTLPVIDERVGRIQPGGSIYTFNYEGTDPDGDGLYYPYSGEDFVGGTDPNRNYGEPLWGDCANNQGCSFLSGAQTYAGPAPFSEPETAAVAAFLKSHANIVSLESLHSGVNEIYPPWFLYPDDAAKTTMDESYHDAVAQYISQQTGYKVIFGGQYAVKGDTTGYSYIGSSQDPDLGLDFFVGGLLSFTTEVYGMGSVSGSAEAVRDWFPRHYQQFDTNWPQGAFIAWSDFPWCTTCDPDQMPGPLDIFNYLQYTEYFLFKSSEHCGGESDPDIFHCDYWNIAGSTNYYADFDIFAYFNPPAVNRCYKDWNCDGSALVRTVDKQIKHLLYRLYVAPFIRINTAQTAVVGSTLSVAIENTGFLRSSIMTGARDGRDPLNNRFYDHGLVNVRIYPFGFKVKGARSVNIGWLGGGRPDDPAPKIKQAEFEVKELSARDMFIITAGSDKTGKVIAIVAAIPTAKPVSTPNDRPNDFRFDVVWTNYVQRPEVVDHYFNRGNLRTTAKAKAVVRALSEIKQDRANAEQRRLQWRRLEGPFELVPGHAKAMKLNLYH